jgi:hypothetical protein
MKGFKVSMKNEIGDKIASLEAHAKRIIGHSGGEPPDQMNGRLEHLETRVGRIEGKLDTVIERLGVIATKSDMRNYLLTGVGLFLAIVAILVGSMGWLETRVSRVQPSPQATPAPTVIYVSPLTPPLNGAANTLRNPR